MSGVTVLGTQLYCWCGRPLKNLYCEGCSSRPFVCECFDGSTTKLSQQFSKLPRLVQENFRFLDLSRVWQKTPAELTPEERVYLNSTSSNQLQSPPPLSQQTAPPLSVSNRIDSAQVARLFPSPIIRISNVSALASVGEPIDLSRVAKAFPGAARLSDRLSVFLAPGVSVEILGTGQIRCPMAESEEKAWTVIQEAVRQLRARKVKIRNEPVMQNVRVGPVSVFLGRGIAIQSLPERIPNSLYAHTLGDRIEGKYNRAGEIIPVKSMEDIGMAMNEIRQGTGIQPSPIHGWNLMLPYLAYLKIGIPPAIAQMYRSPDIDGNMKMTGYVSIRTVFPSTAAAIQAAHNMDKVFEEAEILGPLTPRDKITEKVLRSDPRAFDYFANDPVVWAPGFMPERDS